MWKIAKLSLLVILLGCGTLRAQHYIGVRGGWGGGSARFTPSRETGTEWGLYSGGISYKFYTAQKFVGAIQADLQYMGRGFMYDLQSKGDTSYHRTINSFELPLMWQPHFYFMQRHGRSSSTWASTSLISWTRNTIINRNGRGFTNKGHIR